MLAQVISDQIFILVMISNCSHLRSAGSWVCSSWLVFQHGLWSPHPAHWFHRVLPWYMVCLGAPFPYSSFNSELWSSHIKGNKMVTRVHIMWLQLWYRIFHWQGPFGIVRVGWLFLVLTQFFVEIQDLFDCLCWPGIKSSKQCFKENNSAIALQVYLRPECFCWGTEIGSCTHDKASSTYDEGLSEKDWPGREWTACVWRAGIIMWRTSLVLLL